MKRNVEILGATIAWFAIITQFILMLQNRQATISETIIRFFSFFTILTNTLVAVYFTTHIFQSKKQHSNSIFFRAGTTTSITAFILIVGIVYQIALRHVWTPTGLQLVADELLHTFNPLFFLLYWILYAKKTDFALKPIFKWLSYPIVYILFILVRGHFSGFYPYPFLNVPKIGYGQTIFHIFLILIAMLTLMTALILIGRKRKE